MNFEEAVEHVLKFEGGYVNDPKDLGGETKYGISKRAFPNEDIKNLTVDRAKLLYKKFYWDVIKAEQLPESIRLAMFDTAVNSGIRRAILLLQKSLRVSEDGILGPVTLGFAKNHDNLLPVYLANRAKFLAGLTTFERFGIGWLTRLFELAQHEKKI